MRAVWDHEMLGRFAFVWTHAATFEDYTIESSYDPQLFAKAGSVTLKGAVSDVIACCDVG